MLTLFNTVLQWFVMISNPLVYDKMKLFLRVKWFLRTKCFFFNNFYWSIVDLQCCVSFCHIAICYIYPLVFYFPNEVSVLM